MPTLSFLPVLNTRVSLIRKHYNRLLVILSFLALLTPDVLAQKPPRELRHQYDTLIPILDSCYLTYSEMDTTKIELIDRLTAHTYFEAGKIEPLHKWGIINFKGEVILPFIYDAIKAVSEDSIIVVRYRSSYSLNTGIPRYVYLGEYQYLNQLGVPIGKGDVFSKTIEFLADLHHSSFVISEGPELFLPSKEVFQSRFRILPGKKRH